MRIAHISDLHVGISNTRFEYVEKLIQGIKKFGVDHLVITGDLTQSGRFHEYQKVVQMLDNSGFYSYDRLTVIPGNHDLFSFFFKDFQSSGDLYRKIHKLPRAGIEVYKYHRQDYAKDLHFFNSFFKKTFNGTLLSIQDSSCGYPFIKLIGENIALIGLDSNQIPRIPGNIVCSNGYLVHKSTKEILSSDKIRNRIKIVLMHHYLHSDQYVTSKEGAWFSDTMRLTNRSEVIELLTESEVDLILHGHYHINEKYWVSNDSLIVVNSGYYRDWSLIEVNNGKIKINT
jgi:3',5'-cyclic AMP phosphodiesterase CpdA